MIKALAAALAFVTPLAIAPNSRADDVAGLVAIGGDRSLFLNCQGAGSPLVFVIPGAGSYAEAWNAAVEPNDPVRTSPYDLIAEATITPTAVSTQPLVARTTRICTYDRPGTRPDGPDRSTPVPQPHTVGKDVDDVMALIRAADLPTPMVFVAHSYGGLVLDLLARRHPDVASGLVFSEPTSEFLTVVGRLHQNAAFEADGRDKPPGEEAILPADAFAAIAAAPPLPRVPAIVLTADRFPPPAELTPDNYTQAQIREANDMLAAALGTTNVIVPGTGHNQMLYRPEAVADQIIRVVDEVRHGA
ncbi:alpha/beta fold hydrolase [Mycolicibacterium sediminis]|uniref:Alpha/beta hydrolase fold n=1 Tax=Mycolicibacterium sediminis TaxID=1286180 RepID=A0A7I7QJY9_9MYCO|nr:alpha/beta hydrolase [Mycolicibacterium sediminis]BBY26621.1 alpha/beta hydrolase fold precursor [Mycolicibacterium sediminis]